MSDTTNPKPRLWDLYVRQYGGVRHPTPNLTDQLSAELAEINAKLTKILDVLKIVFDVEEEP